jgi:hypothetical protein
MIVGGLIGVFAVLTLIAGSPVGRAFPGPDTLIPEPTHDAPHQPRQVACPRPVSTPYRDFTGPSPLFLPGPGIRSASRAITEANRRSASVRRRGIE